MSKTVWKTVDDYMTKSIAEYKGVRIERGPKHSQGYHYYFHWCENIYWVASHSRMSNAYNSLRSIKCAIDHKLSCEIATPKKSLHVTRLNDRVQCLEMIRKLELIKAADADCAYLCDKRIGKLNRYLNLEVVA